MLKGIIFDFDGVIAESTQVKTDAFVELYSPFGNEVVQKVVLHHEVNGGMSRFEKIKFYHELYLHKKITNKEVFDLAEQFSELVVDKVIAVPYVPGVLEFIQKNSEQYKLFISTGTPTVEMKQILDARTIAQYFTSIFGSPEKKIDHIRKIMSKHRLKPDELIFFGDSDSDMNAAAFHRVPFIMRIHPLNQNYFVNYTGQTINNFHSLPSNIL